MAEGKDVELRIRARDYSQKTLEQVAQAIGDLTKAQDAQIASARKGDTGIKALEDSYKKLEQAAQALLNQRALIKTFEAQSAAAAQVAEKVASARTAQEDYARSLAGQAELTKAQQRETEKLALAVTRAEGAQQRATDRLTATTSRLKEYGIEAGNVTRANAQIAAGVATVNAALEKQDQSITTLDSHLKAHKATIEAKAEADARAAAAAKQAAGQEQARIELSKKWAAALTNISRAQAQAAASEFDGKRAAAAREDAKRIEMADKWAAALNKIEQAQYRATAASAAEVQAQAAMRTAMQRAADQAEAAARGYATLARSVSSVRGNDLQQQLRGIVDPAGAAMATVGGLEQSIGALERRVAGIRGPVRNYKAALQEMAAAQRSLNSIAGDIDGYRRQLDAVRAARAEYSQARGAVRALVTELRSGAAGEDIGTRMAAASTKLRQASAAMSDVIGKAQGMQAGLRAAGVATNDLAGAEAKLVSQAQRSVAAVTGLTAAVQQHGQAVDGATVKHRSFLTSLTGIGEGGRTTLSWLQRIKGELLALAAAYAGVQAAMGLAKGTIDVVLEGAKIESRLGEVFGGDQSKVKAEWDYLQSAAKRLHLSFSEMSLGYTKFLIGTKAGGVTLEQTRFIFENLALASKRAGLSNEEFGRVMKAVEQMASKGQIQLEELKGQLGDALPGAIGKMAAALNMTMPDLMAKIEKDKLSATALINLARELGKANDTVVDSVASRLRDSIADLETAKFNFQKALGDSGFTEAYTEFLNKLTAFMTSADGKQAIRDIADGFIAITNALIFATEHFTLIKSAVIIFAGAAVTQLGQVVLSMGAMRTAALATALATGGLTGAVGTMAAAMGAGVGTVGALTGAVGFLTTALRFLSKWIPIVGIAITAWEVGSAALDYFNNKKAAAAAKAPERVGTEKGRGTSAKPSDGMSPDPGGGYNADDETVKKLKGSLTKADDKLTKKERNSKLTASKRDLQERLDLVAGEFDADKELAKGIKDETKRAAALEEIEKRIKKRQEIEERLFSSQKKPGGAAGAARKREKLEDNIGADIAKLQADVGKKETLLDPTKNFDERLKARLADALQQYNKLELRIKELRKVDPKQADIYAKQLQAIKEQAAVAETLKAKQEEAQRLEKRVTDETSLRTQKLAEQEALYQAGAISQKQLLDSVTGINDEAGARISDAVQAVRSFLDRDDVKRALDPNTYAAIRANLAKTDAENNPGRQNTERAKVEAEKRLNLLTGEREQIEARIRQQKDLGLITDVSAADQINANNEAFKRQITDASTALITYLQLLRTDQNQGEVDAQIAKIRELQLRTQEVKREFSDLENQAMQTFAGGITSGVESASQAVADLLTGQKSLGDSFEDLGRAAGRILAGMLKDLATYIIKMQIANAMAGSDVGFVAQLGKSMGGSIAGSAAAGAANAAGEAVGSAEQAAAGAAFAGTVEAAAITAGATQEGAAVVFAGLVETSAVTFQAAVTMAAAQLQAAAAANAVAGAFHVGGVIGGPAPMSRSISPSIFASAPRYHSGTPYAGLKRDEVPAVLQRGEEVLRRDNPRHILNGGGQGGGGGGQQTNRFVLVDDRAKVAEAMASAAGETVTLQHLRRNIPTLKQWMGK